MGLLRIDGTSGNDKLIGTAASEEILGFAGNDRIFGRGGNDLLRGGDGDDKLFGGSGNDRLRGDHGDDTLTGGAGHDRFIFNLEGGTDTVKDYQDEIDRLDFTNFHLAGFDDLMSHAAQVGANTVFTMAGGETIILENVLISVLDAGDFRI
jgi:Ca2+-binding RTX toxin-like protein